MCWQKLMDNLHKNSTISELVRLEKHFIGKSTTLKLCHHYTMMHWFCKYVFGCVWCCSCSPAEPSCQKSSRVASGTCDPEYRPEVKIPTSKLVGLSTLLWCLSHLWHSSYKVNEMNNNGPRHCCSMKLVLFLLYQSLEFWCCGWP